jgi:hypothetical protein
MVWVVVRSAGITMTGKTHIRRCGFMLRARRERRAGTATSGGVVATSLISCVSGMACLLARCGGAFEREKRSKGLFRGTESDRGGALVTQSSSRSLWHGVRTTSSQDKGKDVLYATISPPHIHTRASRDSIELVPLLPFPPKQHATGSTHLTTQKWR